MSNILENFEKDLTIKKNKLLYTLHVVVPIALVMLSTVGMILSFLQPTGSTKLQIQDILNNTSYNITTELSTQDKVIELLNLNNPKDQEILNNVIQTFNFIFSILAVVYSKMMNNQNHTIGTDNIKLKSEKNTLLEQITNITSSLSHPASLAVGKDITISNFMENAHVRMPTLISNQSPNNDDEVLHTGRSNSTVYIKPYEHNPPFK